MRHKVTLTLDQSADHPDEQIADADELERYLRREVEDRAGTDGRPTVSFGSNVFTVEVDSIRVGDTTEFITALQRAKAAAERGSNDDEIDALWDTVAAACGLLNTYQDDEPTG